jgi:hypothetical protein
VLDTVANTSTSATGLQVNGVFVEKFPLASPPTGRSAATAGTIDIDSSNNVWLCVADGSPGQWRKLGGPDSGGVFHPLAPTRVFDSRVAAPHKGQIAGGHSVTVSVKDGRNSTTGAVNHANLVPAKATAIACNVTVTNTVGAGHLTVNPGGVTGATTFTVSWSASGQTHTSGTIAKINAATLQVTLAVAGRTKAYVIVDITGYWR